MPKAENKARSGKEISQDAARAIMDDIRVLNGGLPEEDWQRMSEKGKRSHMNLQLLAGNGIIHVAKDLYDADARFIFELIQNADDNKYSAADHQGQLRFLHFKLHHDRIMVESNEDGFSEQDIRAICSIHQSTKRQAGGYVGHKGIGFKLVFKVAHKVHIQSGPFCCSLEHKEGESGLGMVTPSNVARENLPETVKTRMTLLLASADDFDARARELKDPLDQERCYRTELPKVLSSHLGIRDEKALQTFRTVFTTSEKILESILNDDGIISFSHPESREAESQSSDGTDSDAISISSHVLSREDSGEGPTFNSRIRDSSPVNHGIRNMTSGSTNSYVFSQNVRSTHRAHQLQRAVHRHVISSSPGRTNPDLGTIIGQAQYVEALTNVINQARGANFRGTLQTPARTHRNNRNSVSGYGFSIESPNRLDRDIKVGAAGELYVFERLLQLDLPGFSRSNWRSTIRKNVIVHPDYQNLAPWNGSETADIVYYDSDSVLTSILINEGHLPGSPRNNITPTYYIEVKTTTSECETPFFMSNSQYVRMQSYALRLGAGPTEDDRVYMIFRVSKVTSRNIGMKLYFDPEKLRQERRLIFTADTWSVRPPEF
ncbi:uncharacterized protein N7503_001824 [Penicillium pulvis]|uniref:uncharacterized protein n=1 Tax=Penicillium pulvis TaxID=1562058 RepID=UPI0025481DD6|nr:uncharacterized protein N7503_001824 [Penicillium pulvis]KAJ5809606.1 hypothetical protein N7503_001824 [Penicillium pulvis]